METAEELSRRHWEECLKPAGHGDPAGLIEADRNATRLALLDELEPLLERSGRNAAALDVLRAKYETPPAQGQQGKMR